ncbi:hypothetical protein C4B24_04560 [Mycoplasma marinum]|uniref:ABC transmembrane type-1 domain-containing protein n=2 Tax=Mycoplasma marinum TaxID=1937190 RepID=A0A4R0XQA2_9MOLU|nr:hypothetical protein C4B24_04560 [Mycoplasma marinum]
MKAKRQVAGTLFTIAPVLVMGIFVFASFIIGIMLVFYKGKLTADMSDIENNSMKNFALVGKDPMFKEAIIRTLKYAGIVTSISIIASLIIAAIINGGKIKGKKVFLTIYFLPQVTSAVASTIIFYKIFGGDGALGVNLAKNPKNIIYIIILAGLWVQISGSIVTFNTAFTNIGRTEYEAASLDGAGTMTKFFKITLPALAPIIAYQLMMTLIVSMAIFGQSFIVIALGISRPEDATTWSVLGFQHIIGAKGIVSNVGLGMIELLSLGAAIFVLSIISNKIQPIDGKGKK